MSSNNAEHSDDDTGVPAFEHMSASDKGKRTRSTRACDHCRRTKSKCERLRNASGSPGCRGCIVLGLSCTFSGTDIMQLLEYRPANCIPPDPSHKRGPPKGYILTLERRLHQVEALLGTIVGSDDPRARSLIHDLCHDQLAKHIIQKVNAGPFGPYSGTDCPFSSTKEDFLASISCDSDDTSSGQFDSGQDLQSGLALCSPNSEWQNTLKALLSSPHAHSPVSATGGSFTVEWARRTTASPSEITTSSFVHCPQTHTETQLDSAPLTSASLFDGHGWGPDSIMTASTAHQIARVAQSRQSPSTLLHITDDVYVDADGRFRTAVSGHTTRSSDTDTSQVNVFAHTPSPLQ